MKRKWRKGSNQFRRHKSRDVEVGDVVKLSDGVVVVAKSAARSNGDRSWSFAWEEALPSDYRPPVNGIGAL